MARGIQIDSKITGPFFEHGERELKIAQREWQEDMIREGEAKLEAQLYPGHGVATGEYKGSVHGAIRASKFGDTYGLISAGPKGDRKAAIIGVWLEGSRSRHERHRFKGYHIWRVTTTHLKRLANELAGRVYARATKRLT